MIVDIRPLLYTDGQPVMYKWGVPSVEILYRKRVLVRNCEEPLAQSLKRRIESYDRHRGALERIMKITDNDNIRQIAEEALK